MREIANKSSLDQRIIVFALTIFICVFLGPFNTGADLELWTRVAFWTMAVVSVGMFVELCIFTALSSPILEPFHFMFRIIIGSAIGSVPGTSFVLTLNKVFRPEHSEAINFPILWAQVTVMGVMVAGLDLLISNRSRVSQAISKLHKPETTTPPEASAEITELKPARLFQRLPVRLREAQIISMSMQDHYVEVTTTNGSEMILMRLSDAIDLLDQIDGAQTHRSHWVSKAHAIEMTKNARRHELKLSDGRSIPVSNSFKAAVNKMLNEKKQA